jgi:hypothetical protein
MEEVVSQINQPSRPTASDAHDRRRQHVIWYGWAVLVVILFVAFAQFVR